MLGILADVRTLIREEIELARAELRNEVGRLRGAAIGFGMAAASLTFGSAIHADSRGDRHRRCDGLAALGRVSCCRRIVMIAVGSHVTGGGATQAPTPWHALPSETLSTLKENSEWIAKRLSSAQR